MEGSIALGIVLIIFPENVRVAFLTKAKNKF